MKVLIINCHSDNRGDESAIHALVDELCLKYPNIEITLSIRGQGTLYPNMPANVKMISQFIPSSVKTIFAHNISVISNGKINLSSKQRQLVHEVKSSDLIIHAPGGPSIGDTYYNDEPTYLRIFDLIKRLDKPYMFYAPSMGPFNNGNKKRNKWRKKVLEHSSAIVLRDPISEQYVKAFIPSKTVYLALDSALQHDIDTERYIDIMKNNKELSDFLYNHERCIGITITDLKWHPVHSKSSVSDCIRDSFKVFIEYLTKKNYGIIFIPQLYGAGNDYDYMKSFCLNDIDFYVLPSDNEQYDAYFQQYLISKLYAVIGMRYHSNIFSAKMGTPFISISYEQKMQGFMKKLDLGKYCMNISELSEEQLTMLFSSLENNYSDYKKYLLSVHDYMKSESFKTTSLLFELCERRK